MTSDTSHLHTLSNFLATVPQVSSSSSQLDGIPADLEASIRYAGASLTQAAGILLRLPQEVIATAVITFTRFYVGPEGGSFRLHAAKDISAASLYLHAKISPTPISPRSLLLVYTYLLSSTASLRKDASPPDPESYYLSEGTYLSLRNTLFQNETLILRTLSYTMHVSLPHPLALTYLQTLSVLPSPPTPRSRALATRAIAHLNTALFSPQLLCLTHQPNALAVAAIYLSAREVGVKLPGVEWWEVFDVDREALGFLVVGLGSVERWVERERENWSGERSRALLTIEGVEKALSEG